jgi:glycosyltransferase involved in cell wall biosynthesis
MTVVNFGVDDLSGGGEKKGKLIYSNRLHEPLYRIDRAIDLFFDFMAVNPGWKMVVAGQGSLSGALKEKAQTNAGAKSIEFVGWLKPEENLDFYRKASIYLSLPRSDATSVSLLEAMSAGCIPVVSDLPANREWVRDGVNGIIFNGSRENPLTRALALDPERVSGYNREMLAQRASPTKARETFIGIYEKYRDRL